MSTTNRTLSRAPLHPEQGGNILPSPCLPGLARADTPLAGNLIT